VGNEDGAKEALEELDDELSNKIKGGVRDKISWILLPGLVAEALAREV